MSAEVAAVLREARELIVEPLHWTKRRFHSLNPDGSDCYCSLGAAEEAAFMGAPKQTGHRRRSFVWGALARAVLGDANASEGDWNAVARFNDNPYTTHADVLALFDRAIAAEESQP